MTASDQDLLREYVTTSSEDAFSALVGRHLNLVYSAALRQVSMPHLAEEVAQCVFIDLARSAHRLQSGTLMTAWLYQVTRRTAIDLVRRESRRIAREQIAMEPSDTPLAPEDWAAIAPLLDVAMQAIPEKDRTAILLRFFENRSLLEVGASLGITEDAAQKRIHRAVGRLRVLLEQRTPVSAAGLGSLLAAHAVTSAPSGLGPLISAAVAKTALSTLTTTLSGKFLPMLSLHKTALSLVTVIAVGTAVYQSRRVASLEAEALSLRTQLAAMDETGQREQDQSVRRLESMEGGLARLRDAQTELLRLRAEVTELRQIRVENTPDLPESPPSDPAAARLGAPTSNAGLERLFQAALAGDAGAVTRFIMWQRGEGLPNEIFEGIREVQVRNLTNSVATTTSLRIVHQRSEGPWITTIKNTH